MKYETPCSGPQNSFNDLTDLTYLTDPMTVTLFIPCFVDLMYPRVGISMVQLFEKLGHKVEYPEELTCCGQPAFNSGYWPEARDVARPVLQRLKKC